MQKQGNNNSYCQDNAISWLDWHCADHALIDYTVQLIALRKQIPLLSTDKWWSDDAVQWLKTDGLAMQLADWQNHHTKAIQILLQNKWLILVNAKFEPQQFLLPEGNWQPLKKKKKIT